MAATGTETEVVNMKGARNFLGTLLLSLSLAALPAAAQTLPVQVSIQGNTATAVIGNPLSPAADITLQFDDATGLSASSLGISARLVDVSDAAVLARLPNASLNLLPAAQPLLVTIAPPATGGLSLRGVVRFELHTHALPYTLGSSFRVFKAPPAGNFRDITHQIAQGSVRARGTTSGFSQFLVLTDLRATDAVVLDKIGQLHAAVAALPSAERPAFEALLTALEGALAGNDHAGAISLADQLAQRARNRAAAGAIGNEWRATRDVQNQAGDLEAGAATLKFSIAYLRDFGA
jgi:hypothetical protein